MCEDCGSLDRERPSPALIARARAIEAKMPGERVPESAWAVFFHHSGGALSWVHHHRMLLACNEAAGSLLEDEQASAA
jgi:hypothetical protein